MSIDGKKDRMINNVAIALRDFINANDGDVSPLFESEDENGVVKMTDLGNLIIKSAMMEVKEE